jgi:hypothetical protein
MAAHPQSSLPRFVVEHPYATEGLLLVLGILAAALLWYLNT